MGRKRKANFAGFETARRDSPFLRITQDMMQSKAWLQLDVYDVTVYIYLKNKFRVNNTKGTDNRHNLSLTYSEMKNWMCKDRFTRSIDNLLKYGFVDLVAHKPQNRRPTIYSLSARWQKFGEADYEEVKRPKASRKTGKK